MKWWHWFWAGIWGLRLSQATADFEEAIAAFKKNYNSGESLSDYAHDMVHVYRRAKEEAEWWRDYHAARANP